VGTEGYCFLINNDNTRLTAIFQGTPGKPLTEGHLSDFCWSRDEGGGDDNWSHKSCEAPVKSSPPTPNFLQTEYHS